MIRETLVYSNYAIMEERQSQIDRSAILLSTIAWCCPSCKRRNDGEIEHGHTAECVCGLHATRYGNRMVCTIPG